jgi:hypothetical protein
LHRRTNVADLVEKDGSAVRFLEEAFLLPDGARECTSGVAKEPDSRRESVRDPQSTATKRPLARSLWRCRAAAMSSFPVPLSPSMSTVLREVATRATVR